MLTTFDRFCNCCSPLTTIYFKFITVVHLQPLIDSDNNRLSDNTSAENYYGRTLTTFEKFS